MSSEDIVSVSIPMHVSGFWVPIIRNDYLSSGSLGAGLTLKPKASFAIRRSTKERICTLKLNDTCLDNLPLVNVINEVLDIKRLNVKIIGKSLGSLGAGLGLSASVAIAYSLAAILDRFGEVPTLNRAGAIAHVAEVKCLTGLADVIAEIYGGGLVIRIAPGAPGVGVIDVLPIKDNVVVLITFMDPLLKSRVTTPQMLIDRLKYFYRVGMEAYSKFIKNPTLENFLEVSRMFSESVGFLRGKVRDVITNVLNPFMKRGDVIGYYVKKSILLTVVNKYGYDKIIEALRSTGLNTLVASISTSGTQVFHGGRYENT